MVRYIVKLPRRRLKILDGDGAWRQRALIRRRAGGGRLLVDEFFQLFTGLEVRHLLRRHIHLVPGLGIAALARLAFPQPETAEAAQLDLLPTVERLDDAAEDRIDDDF